ncbi:MAG: NAD(P)-dependent oxidoreductase [Rhodovulum sulfidophilum]|uniref:NAD(P)-dependent oxidoreductase n=1 Tax=Rhodovulum sulfidophilum TaxID=35806 RepID=A0A2W5N1E8_RHOSU|nr:MAG: NAD(P)-dependent oxidoreductase [Rhodovulum sulfidophilum]
MTGSTPEGPRVLVTGAGGFVMSVLIARLLGTMPAARVTALDLAPLDAAATAYLAPWRDRIDFVLCDVTDRVALAEVVGAAAPEVVVHGATITHVPAWEYERPHGFIDVNISGTLNVLEAARAAGALRRVLHVSSAAVYGGGDPTVAPAALAEEERFFRPSEYYGIGKLGGELVAKRFSELHGIPAPVVRFTRVFGPMERPTGGRKLMHLPRAMMAHLLAGTPIRVTERSRATAGDWISVEDVAEAMLAILGTEHANGIYNIATGRPIPLPEMLAAAPVAVDWVPDDAPADADFDPALRHGQHAWYDIAALRRDTGWEPRPIAAQIASYATWARANPAAVAAEPLSA